MPILPPFRWPFGLKRSVKAPTAPIMSKPADMVDRNDVRRHFFNEEGFQCYASFFPYWGGWITAGHVLTDAGHSWPDFTGKGEAHIWPDGLDAAIMRCDLPRVPPPRPKAGQKIIAKGYPAGSRNLEYRHGQVYLERGVGSGTWIAHIETPDEPVVSGMSGGPVVDAKTEEPIGILITRNSPADLNGDRDPDESCDFIALRAVWDAVRQAKAMV